MWALRTTCALKLPYATLPIAAAGDPVLAVLEFIMHVLDSVAESNRERDSGGSSLPTCRLVVLL